MSLKNAYRVDIESKWVSVIDGIEVNVRHFDVASPRYTAMLAEVTKPIRKLIERNALTPDQDRRYGIRAFVKASVLGWRTVDPDGNIVNANAITVDTDPVEFTPEAAEQVFFDYPRFHSDVVDEARRIENFRLTEEAEKN